MKKYLKYVLVSLSVLLLFACDNKNASDKNGKLKIVATTGMIADGIQAIVGDKAEVVALMGPGVDPHLYKATQGDIKKLQEADVIFYNGLHLEGKMAEVLEKLGKKKKVLAVSEGVEPTELRKLSASTFDPHIWFSVVHWQSAMQFAAEKLQEIDTKNAAEYKKNAEKYHAELEELNTWVTKEIESIPENQRILITAHDAFGYFGEQYNIKVKGLQGISTVTEFGLKDITELVNFIVTNKVKAVFVESSVPTKSIDAVVEGCNAQGHEVKLGGTLYSDAMGEAGTDEGTYVGMVKANVNKIVNGLK